MIIYPAIDLKGGQCVRLMQGDMEQATVYGDDPCGRRRQFEEKGAQLAARGGPGRRVRRRSDNCEPLRQLSARSRSPCSWAAVCATWTADACRSSWASPARSSARRRLENPAFVQEAVDAYRPAASPWASTPGRAGRHARLGEKTIAMCRLAACAADERRGRQNGHLHRHLQGRHADRPELRGHGAADAGNRPSMSSLPAAWQSWRHVAQCRDIGAAGVIIGKALYTDDVSWKTPSPHGGDTHADQANHPLPGRADGPRRQGRELREHPRRGRPGGGRAAL